MYFAQWQFSSQPWFSFWSIHGSVMFAEECKDTTDMFLIWFDHQNCATTNPRISQQKTGEEKKPPVSFHPKSQLLGRRGVEGFRALFPRPYAGQKSCRSPKTKRWNSKNEIPPTRPWVWRPLRGYHSNLSSWGDKVNGCVTLSVCRLCHSSQPFVLRGIGLPVRGEWLLWLLGSHVGRQIWSYSGQIWDIKSHLSSRKTSTN